MKKKALIVLCGMDGSGKSTLAGKLQLHFKNKGLAVSYTHGHTYTTAKNTFRSDPSSVHKYKLFWRLLLPFAFIDNLLTYFLNYRYAIRSSTIIADRYLYDKVVRLIYYGICPRWLAVWYLRLLPKPDYCFFLDVDPKKAVDRKKEFSIDTQKKYRKHYLFAARILDQPIIDTGQSIGKCVQKIMHYV